jgi:hypothetical protein
MFAEGEKQEKMVQKMKDISELRVKAWRCHEVGAACMSLYPAIIHSNRDISIGGSAMSCLIPRQRCAQAVGTHSQV